MKADTDQVVHLAGMLGRGPYAQAPPRQILHPHPACFGLMRALARQFHVRARQCGELAIGVSALDADAKHVSTATPDYQRFADGSLCRDRRHFTLATLFTVQRDALPILGVDGHDESLFHSNHGSTSLI